MRRTIIVKEAEILTYLTEDGWETKRTEANHIVLKKWHSKAWFSVPTSLLKIEIVAKDILRIESGVFDDKLVVESFCYLEGYSIQYSIA